MLDISLTPRNCVCPNISLSYTCEVNDATEIHWKTSTSNGTDDFQFTANSDDSHRKTNDFQVNFSRVPAAEDYYRHFTSILEVTNMDLNGTDLQCIGFNLTMNVRDTVQICVKGTTNTNVQSEVPFNYIMYYMQVLPHLQL